MIAFFALLIGAAVIASSAVFQLAQKKKRTLRFRGLQLKANCLLTRFPIVFISGPRSLFRLFDHWNDIPLYLREHGYEVFVVEPSGRNASERAEAVRLALSDLKSRCHLIADASLEADLETLSDLKIANVSSFTLVKARHRKRFERPVARSARDLRPTASALELFEIDDLNRDLQDQIHGFSEHIRLTLLAAHNFLMKRRTSFIHPLETAEFASPGFKYEARFLDLAISLAERDLISPDASSDK